jgi:predicted AAA+ superfamily ATPase
MQYFDLLSNKHRSFFDRWLKNTYASIMERYLKNQINQDLKRKMVFLAGPRQVGKTTLSKSLIKNFDYMNWDIDKDRTRILNKEFKARDLWIFDEIHKYKSWRNYLKGIFDQFRDEKKILVTGSAKLDLLRKGGDSLQGRYHFLRLHPLSINELKGKSQNDLIELFELGGFPEPYFGSSKSQANRWTREYRQKLIREEVATNELIQDLGNMELLVNRLPDLVGSPLSINGIREDLQLAHKTISKWLDALERLYGIYRIAPFGQKLIKAVKKEQKMYLYDWNAIKDLGSRFENMVANHLLKWIHFEQDTMGRNLELRYFRDTEKREVDFVIIEDNNPTAFIECKYSDTSVSDHLRYLKSKWPNVDSFQIYLNGNKDYVDGNGIRVQSGLSFLTNLSC